MQKVLTFFQQKILAHLMWCVQTYYTEIHLSFFAEKNVRNCSAKAPHIFSAKILAHLILYVQGTEESLTKDFAKLMML